MDDRRAAARGRTLKNGKILLNDRHSVIDCVVRNLSDEGAKIQVESQTGIPPLFDLLMEGDETPRPCNVVWQFGNEMGIAFHTARSKRPKAPADSDFEPQPIDEVNTSGTLVRAELLSLRAALDEVPLGVVLLDAELRAQFINRAFRKMWRLPDTKANSRPAFVALMYHGRDTRAYEVPTEELDEFVAQRVALVKAGDPTPLDLRLASGEVIRFQCTILPSGGRMLSYTYVTDIVRHVDELETLRTALDNVEEGVILLDAQMNAQFMNRAVRRIWKVSDEQADRKPSYAELVNDSRLTGTYDVSPAMLDEHISSRISRVRSGNPTPTDLRVSDGRIVRSRCAVLPNGGRMLTYCDVSDLVRNADQLELFATTDGMTAIFNRRHFLALAEGEWGRFQRYHRPLTMLLVDIDRFKAINDCFGHAVGDQAITHVATLCRQEKRSSDIVARMGGDEFAILLPETDPTQGNIVAERFRSLISERPFVTEGKTIGLTVSIGAATARIGMPSVDALMKAADQGLYEAKAQGRNRVGTAAVTFSGEVRLAAE